MNYKSAYLLLFNRLTDIINLMESLDPNKEKVDPLPLLKSIQIQSEEVIINSTEPD